MVLLLDGDDIVEADRIRSTDDPAPPSPELVPLRTIAAASAMFRIPAFGSSPKTMVFDASAPAGMG